MASDQSSAAGCVMWCGLVAGGMAIGVLLSLAVELVWPTRVEDGDLGVGVIMVILWRTVFAALIGAIIGGVTASWTVRRFRRSG